MSGNKYRPSSAASDLGLHCLLRTVQIFRINSKRARERAGKTLNFNPSDRFQHEKKESSKVHVFIILFRLNVAFNNLSLISGRCLDVTGSSTLTLRVLPH